MKKNAIVLPLLLVSLMSAPAQLVRVLPSQEPPTNSLLPGDLITIAKSPGTPSEKIYKMTYLDFFNWLVTSGLVNTSYLATVTGATNGMNTHISSVENAASALAIRAGNLEGATNGLTAETLTTNSILAKSLLFIGDSTTDEHGNTGVDQGSTYPSLLMQKPGWNTCSNYFNGGIGSSTAQQWNATSNYFSVAYGMDKQNGLSLVNSPVPVASLLPGTTNGAILFVDLLYNDAGSRTFQQMTNDIGSLWSRGTNCLVVSFTVMTNNTMNNTSVTNIQAINAWIISQSNAYYKCVRLDLVMTNDNLFTSVDHVHPNLAGNLVIANRIALDVPPPAPPMNTLQFNPEPHLKYLSVSNQADFAGFRVSGDSGYVPNWNIGQGSEYLYQVIRSRNAASGAWSPFSIRGDSLWLFGNSGVIVVSRSNFADQPSTTNDFYVHGSVGVTYGISSDTGPGYFFVSNNVAANGSLLADPTGGKPWLRTNSTWVHSW